LGKGNEQVVGVAEPMCVSDDCSNVIQGHLAKFVSVSSRFLNDQESARNEDVPVVIGDFYNSSNHWLVPEGLEANISDLRNN